MGYSWQSVTA